MTPNIDVYEDGIVLKRWEMSEIMAWKMTIRMAHGIHSLFIDYFIVRRRYVYNLGSMKFNKCNTKYINILKRMETTTIANYR